MSTKHLLRSLLYAARDFRCRDLYRVLRSRCEGAVLDVGGANFYRTAMEKGVSFDSWTILEVPDAHVTQPNSSDVRYVFGDGCAMEFADESFDTVLNIQVLEHVFEPNLMMKEMCRVLRPGGHLVMLVPQTSTLHMVPNHYYNFTRFWIQKSLVRNGMTEILLQPIGGVWSSMASHLVYFFLQSFRLAEMSTKECRRNLAFFLLFPFMALFSIATLPICLIFGMGDLTEEPNNHMVVAQKPERS